MKSYRAFVLPLLMSSSTAPVDGIQATVERSMRRQEETNRTYIDVEYEYQLEVDGIRSSGSTADVLELLDLDILDTIQRVLPNGGTGGSGVPPNVQFESIRSVIFSACFTKSEQCSLIRSKILVSYDGVKPEHSVEQVTLHLVQDYLLAFSKTRDTITVTYNYPYIVSALTQFDIRPVAGPMGEIEIGVLESTFMEVFGAIIAAMEGDTLVRSTDFVFQDIFPVDENRRNRNLQGDSASDTPYLLSAQMLQTGYCRDCNDTGFMDVVSRMASSNLIAYQNKLKVNGLALSTKYFAHVSNITYQVPELPSKLPPIADQSIFDDQPPAVKRKVPWFLYVGLVIGLCIISIGSSIVYRENLEIQKEEDELSTSDSEYGAGNEEGSRNEGDNEEAAGQNDGQRDYIDGNAFEDGTYDELEEYQVETIAPTEDGKASDYEVYVF